MGANRDPGVVVRLLAPALRYLDRLGHDVPEVLTEVGLAPDLLTQPDGLVAADRFADLLESAVELTGDADFGLHAGEHFRPGDYGLLEVMIGQAKGDEMRQLVNRFHPLLGGSDREPLAMRDGVIVFTATDPDKPQTRTMTEYSLVCGLALARLLLRRHGIASWASFTHPQPADVSEHQRVLSCELRFDQAENAVAFPPWTPPDVSDAIDHSLASWMVAEATTRMQQLGADATTADRVRTVLLAASGEGFSAPSVAYQLAVSERTLRRQLEAEDTTFVLVRDEVRQAEAERLLASSEDQSVVAIAVHLGFGDASGFHRAFKRWTGSTPAAYRQQHREVGR
ncbi:MAG: AraC family transcriptional regulator ligand-binding domain-containing protein [Acidimicrobiales bacterium]